MRNRLQVIVSLGAAGLLLLTGCGSSGGDNPTVETSSTAAPLASLLPQALRDKGTLVVGSDVAYAPVEFFDTDGKTVIGIDPDLGKAIGKQLGVELKFVNGTFDGLITSLKAKRLDLIMSAMSDNKKRQAEIDFVDYFTAGTSILVKKGNPQKITSLDDFCGKTIAVQRTTTQDDVATAQQKKCAANGQKLSVLKFDRDTEALLQVKQGRAAADMNDFPVAAYNAKQAPNDFEVVGQQIEAGPYGVGVRKEDTALRDAIKAAIQAIIDNGEYAKILQTWSVTNGAVTAAALNGGS
ncbi:MAG: atrA protein [Frankiales bacterium]|nr:atrA protein [Frankiales bacterium]